MRSHLFSIFALAFLTIARLVQADNAWLDNLELFRVPESPVAGWYNRTTPFIGPFDRSKLDSSFLLGVNVYSMVHVGLEAAFFSPNIVVGLKGQVLMMNETDMAGMMHLVQSILELGTPTGQQWIVDDQGITCSPGYTFVAANGNTTVTQYVSGHLNLGQLEKPVGNWTTLPPQFLQLFNLLDETMEDLWNYDLKEDRSLLSLIGNILGDDDDKILL